jgi:uncharacterized RDD family membrane protein YckC
VPVADLPFETASWLRRILALVVDWLASTLVVIALVGPAGWRDDRWSGFATTGVFVLESALFMAVLGGSFGQLATRLRVIRVVGPRRPLTLLMALLRQVLVCMVVPPLIFRPDGRGLHDLACGSATVPLAVLRLDGRSSG